MIHLVLFPEFIKAQTFLLFPARSFVILHSESVDVFCGCSTFGWSREEQRKSFSQEDICRAVETQKGMEMFVESD